MLDFLSNPKETLSHESLSVLALDEVAPGLIAAFDVTKANDEPILAIGVAVNVNPKVMNLLLASPQLYRTLNNQFQCLEELKTHLEGVNNLLKKMSGEESPTFVTLISHIDRMQESSIRACRCVTEGIAKVAEEIRKGY